MGDEAYQREGEEEERKGEGEPTDDKQKTRREIRPINGQEMCLRKQGLKMEPECVGLFSSYCR